MAATSMQEHPGDIFRPKRKDQLPTTLNVLTILTFICSALVFTGSVLLCFFGALQMRKLKKRGFIMYVIGDLLSILKLSLVSVSALAGILHAFSYAIALIFIILYATQLKYMN